MAMISFFGRKKQPEIDQAKIVAAITAGFDKFFIDLKKVIEAKLTPQMMVNAKTHEVDVKKGEKMLAFAFYMIPLSSSFMSVQSPTNSLLILSVAKDEVEGLNRMNCIIRDCGYDPAQYMISAKSSL